MLKQMLSKPIKFLIQFTEDKSDYLFINHISLSELILLLWATSRTIWYLSFGVVSSNFDYVFDTKIWISFFAVISLSHIFGLLFENKSLRLAGLYGYALAWGTLAYLAIWQGTLAPAFPNYFLLFFTTIMVIVRFTRTWIYDAR